MSAFEISLLLTFSAVFFSWVVTTFPGEWQEEFLAKWDKPRWAISPHDWVFNLPFDPNTGRRKSPFSNTLVLPDLNIYDGLKIDDPEKVRWRKYVFVAGRRDLGGAIFNGAILPKVDFTGAYLQSVSLNGAELQGASLDGAELQGALLNRASLRGASLRVAQLQNAQLNRADLQGASLDGAELQGALLNRASLRGASLSRARLQNAQLNYAELQGATLSGAQLQGAALVFAEMPAARLDNLSLEGASLSFAKLYGASLEGTRLEGASLLSAELQGASLAGARLEGAYLGGANFQAASLDDADLQGASLQQADLRGASMYGVALSATDLGAQGEPAHLWRTTYPSPATHPSPDDPRDRDAAPWNIKISVRDETWLSSTEDGLSGSARAWNNKDYMNLVEQIKSLPDDTARSTALNRVRILDCDNPDAALASWIHPNQCPPRLLSGERSWRTPASMTRTMRRHSRWS